MKGWRDSARALVVDPDDRTLLVHFDFAPYPWTPPGGGIEAGESDEHALRRELAEELGLDEFDRGPLLWTREHEFDLQGGCFRGQRERCYLVRVEPFEPEPRIDLAAEHVTELRWWTPAEVARARAVFGPRSLPALCRNHRTRPARRAPGAGKVSGRGAGDTVSAFPRGRFRALPPLLRVAPKFARRGDGNVAIS